MGLEIGSITALITLDASGYKRGADEAKEVNKTLGSSFVNFVTNPVTLAVGAIAAAGGAAAIYANRALDLATANQRLADRTMLSVEAIQALRGEFNRTGRDVNILAPAMTALYNAIDAGRDPASEQARIFREMGVDLRSIGDGDAALRQVVDGLSRIADPLERSATAAQLFGGGVGGIIASALKGADSLDAMIERGRNLGTVLDASTNTALVKLNAQLATVKQGVDGLLLSTVAEFLAGFESSAGNIEAATQRIVRALRDEFGPIARSLGEDTGEVTKNIEEWAELIGEIVEGMRAIADLYQGSWAETGVEGARNGLAFLFTRLGEGAGGYTTRADLLSTPDDIRRLQEARGIAR